MLCNQYSHVNGLVILKEGNIFRIAELSTQKVERRTFHR